MGVFLRDADLESKGLMRQVAQPYTTIRPLTAAAARVRINDKTETERMLKRKKSATWQSEAWAYFDLIGEIKYAFLLTGSIMSRMKLFVGYVDTPSSQPGRIEDVSDLPENYLIATQRHFQRLESGFGGIPGLMRESSINLCVPGECFLVQEKAKPASKIPEKWTIRSTDEVEVDTSGHAGLRQSSSSKGADGLELLPDDSFIGRIWRPHSRYHEDADSSMRALLDLSAELLLLNRTVRATAKSRLNAGALFIPDGLSVAASPDITNEDGDFETAEDDTFEQELIAAMTMPIQDEDSASAVVPLLIRGPGELGNQIKQFSFQRSFDAALTERADRVLDRILQGLDIPKDIVTGLSQVKYALSTDTEILSRSGWKTCEQVEVGEDVYTLNHGTGMGEWQPLLEINIHDHDGPMLRMESATHSSLSTPEHRWAVVKAGKRVAGSRRRWTTSAEGFTANDRVETAAECGNLPREAKYTDDFVRLVALYSSDGYRESPQRGRARANITKTTRNRNPNATMTARSIVASVDPGHAEYAHRGATPDGKPIEGARFRLSPDASEMLMLIVEGTAKVIRTDFIADLTYAQLNLLLDSLIEIGDGNFVNGKIDIRRYWQTDKLRLEPIAMAAILAGYTVRWLDKPILPNKNSLVQGSRPCWGLTATKKRTWFQPYKLQSTGRASWEQYVGKVWCPTTSTHTWLAKCNGKVFFTGNSNALVVNESLYRTHIEPLTLLICDALTMIFMRPAMEAMDFPPEVVDNTVIWYDPTDILTSSDRAQNSDTGFDKYLLSGSTWRQTHGFAETDAPSGDELLNRIVVSRGQITAELTEAVLAKIAPAAFKEARETALEGKETKFPENLQNLLDKGQLPEAVEGEEPLPPEILEGLPIPSPASTGEDAGVGVQQDVSGPPMPGAPA